MNWKALLLPLLLLTSCKQNLSEEEAAQQAALDYVRLVNIAVSNAYYEMGKPIPPTPCTDPLFGMKRPNRLITVTRCTAQKDNADTVLIAALFNKDIAVLQNDTEPKLIKPSELPKP